MTLLEQPTTLPRWATVPETDALSGQPNVVEPPDGKKDSGWHYREKPPRNWWNWIQKTNYDWLAFLDEQKQALHSDYSFNSFETVPTVTAPGGLFVDVGAADAWLNGTKAAYAAQTAIEVADDTTNYIYLDSDGIYKATTSAATASTAARLLTAKVITAAGAITSLVSIARKRSQATHVITVGPGESDFSDLSRAIQHAKMLQAQTDNARVEILINGSLTVSAPITLDAAITIRGAGLGSRITWSFVNGAPITLATGASFARIDDLYFDYTGGTGVDANHAAIRVQAGATAGNVKVRGCVFNGMLRALLVSGTGVAGRWRVLDNDFVTSSVSALDVVGMASSGVTCDFWVVSRNDFQGPSAASSASAISLRDAPNSIIANNTIQGYDKGIVLDDECDVSIITGNVVSFTRTHGIDSDSPGCTISANHLDNCGADAGTQGGSIRCPTTASVRTKIVGNTVTDWQAGFAISSAPGYAIVSGNICQQITGTASSPAISGGIAVQDDFCNIEDNWIDLLVSAAGGSGGKENCYGIKCGLYTTGPGVGFTANGADRCNITGNTIKNLGGTAAGKGAVGIDVGGLSNTHGNTISNIYGIGIRASAPDGSIHGNTFDEYGYGPLAAPYTLSTAPIALAAAADRTSIIGNVGRGLNAGSTTCYPIIFEALCVDCRVRDNKIQAGSAPYQFPVNFHLQDFGTWEWVELTTTDATPTVMAPALAFAADESYFVKTLVRARKSSTNKAAGFEIQAIVRTDGSGVPSIRQQSTTSLDTDDASTDAGYSVVGSTIVVAVVGVAAETWVWRASTKTERSMRDNDFYA